MNKKILALMLIMFSVLVAGCSPSSTSSSVSIDDEKSLSLPTDTASTDTASTDTASTDTTSTETREVNVKAFRFGFEPKIIKAKLGETIKITAESVDVPHGLAIIGYDIDLNLEGSNKKTVEFTANKEGTFPIICSVPCGSGHGSMQAAFIVE
jgi:cytochrome c oxidase subunit II